MANNNLKPFVPQTSDSKSSEQDSPRSIATLPSSSSVDSPFKSPNTHNKRKNSELERYILEPRNPNNTNNEQESEMVMTPMVRKPRGRPPGSKNKPKPVTVFIRNQNHPSFVPILFEIAPGSDVVHKLINYARTTNVGISILSGFGHVTDVVLQDPLSKAPNLPIRGPLYMMALIGSYFDGGYFVPPFPRPSLPLPLNTPPTPNWPACSSFSVLLSGNNGQVFGGVVGGRIIATEPVMVMAVMIKNPQIVRSLRIDGDDAPLINTNAKVTDAVGGGCGGGCAIMGNKKNKGKVGDTNMKISDAYGSTSSLINCPIHIGGVGCNVSLMHSRNYRN